MFCDSQSLPGLTPANKDKGEGGLFHTDRISSISSSLNIEIIFYKQVNAIETAGAVIPNSLSPFSTVYTVSAT